MTPRNRRQFLRHLGVVATGTASTTGVLGRTADRSTTVTAVQADSAAVEWHNTYGEGDYQCKAVVDTPDGVLLVGRTGNGRSASAWLAAIDPDGEPLWTNTFDTQGFTIAADAVANEDGYTVLVTTDESPGIRLVELAGDGHVVARHSLEGPDEMTGRTARVDTATNNYENTARVLQSTPDGYLIGGYHGSHIPRATHSDSEGWVRAVDPDGRTQWERHYDGTAVATIRSLSEGSLLAGSADADAWLQAIGRDGRARWDHTYGGVGGETATAAVPTDGGILYGGHTESAADRHSQALLIRTTADGEFVWRRTYEPQDVVDLRPVDGGVVMTGEPDGHDQVGRDPEKPVSLVDRWGQVRETATVSVDPGAPVGLATFDDGGIAAGGWDRRGGVWLAKVEFDVPGEFL